MQLLKCTYHIITGGVKGICPTHIHCSAVHIVQGSNVVPAFHLQPDPAETMPRSNLCFFSRKDMSRAHTDCTAWRWADQRVKDATKNFPAHTNAGEPGAKILPKEFFVQLPKWFTDPKTWAASGSETICFISWIPFCFQVQVAPGGFNRSTNLSLFSFLHALILLLFCNWPVHLHQQSQRVLSQHAGMASHNLVTPQWSCSLQVNARIQFLAWHPNWRVNTKPVFPLIRKKYCHLIVLTVSLHNAKWTSSEEKGLQLNKV